MWGHPLSLLTMQVASMLLSLVSTQQVADFPAKLLAVLPESYCSRRDYVTMSVTSRGTVGIYAPNKLNHYLSKHPFPTFASKLCPKMWGLFFELMVYIFFFSLYCTCVVNCTVSNFLTNFQVC